MFKALKEKFSKKANSGIVIGAPIEGEVISIQEVSDPTFSEEILGKGIAIKPAKGRVVAPVNAEVALMFDTKHAVSLVTEDGAEILIHVGLDTVQLKGEHFKSFVNAGDKVKSGQVLIEFDIEKIEEAGYSTVCPIVICNTGEFAKVEGTKTGSVKELDGIIKIQK